MVLLAGIYYPEGYNNTAEISNPSEPKKVAILRSFVIVGPSK
jgi:hypothetical protein